jgi:hypothetical protein
MSATEYYAIVDLLRFEAEAQFSRGIKKLSHITLACLEKNNGASEWVIGCYNYMRSESAELRVEAAPPSPPSPPSVPPLDEGNTLAPGR